MKSKITDGCVSPQSEKAQRFERALRAPVDANRLSFHAKQGQPGIIFSIWRVASTFVACGALLWPAAATSQVVYQWRDIDGTVVYSQQPPAAGEGTLMRTLPLAELSGVERSATSRVATISLPVSDLSRQTLEQADKDIAKSIRALQSAELALQRGQTPIAGERRGLARGGSRLTQAYFDRLSLLESQVLQAKSELQLAYAKRDALPLQKAK